MRQTSAEETLRVHRRLRAVLMKHLAVAPVDALATALCYELASILASQAPDVEQAVEAIEALTRTMVEQVREFGVGRPHP